MVMNFSKPLIITFNHFSNHYNWLKITPNHFELAFSYLLMIICLQITCNVLKVTSDSFESLWISSNYLFFFKVTWISSKSLVSFQITLKIRLWIPFLQLDIFKSLGLSLKITYDSSKSLWIFLKSLEFLQNHFQITLKMNFRGLWIPLLLSNVFKSVGMSLNITFDSWNHLEFL